ncbi:MAG: hypothetical protein ACXVQQ_00725 [Gaiellaceae bacterium]
MRAVSLTACSAAVAALVAGCGGHGAPKLAHTDAAELVSLAHRIAGEAPCGQARDIPRLRARAIALVNDGRVPAELQEPLMSAVGALASETPVCLPTVTLASTTPTPQPAPHGLGHDKAHRHHDHGHDKK